MAHKDEEISELSDKIQTLTRDLALDQAELDLLAESEGGLMELSKNINLTTEQAKVHLVILFWAPSGAQKVTI